MPKIQFTNDQTGSIQETFGSDNRFNVSSRSNTREFYVSRDDGQSYTFAALDSTAAAGTIFLFLQNTSTDKKMFVEDVDFITSESGAVFRIMTASGTAAGGNALTGRNLNLTSVNDAQATARGDTVLTGITTANVIYQTLIGGESEAHIEFRGALILGQNDAISINYHLGLTGTASAVIRAFFE